MKLYIKEVLKVKGITVTALAKEIGMKQSSLSCIISGRFPTTLTTIEKIATALDVEVWELFTERIYSDLNAVIEYKGRAFVAHSIVELETVVTELKELS